MLLLLLKDTSAPKNKHEHYEHYDGNNDHNDANLLSI
jgi:hypothetical protein